MANDKVQYISHTHDQVMNWLIANPDRPLRECADHFKYTQSWLSILIHSDAFQAKFKERQDAVFTAVMQDTPAKLKALADIAVEQLADKLTTNTDKKFALDAFDKIMHRAGYAPASQKNPNGMQVTQNNLYMVSADALKSARESMAPRPAEIHQPDLLNVVESEVLGESEEA
jgi:hypothetical protein